MIDYCQRVEFYQIQGVPDEIDETHNCSTTMPRNQQAPPAAAAPATPASPRNRNLNRNRNPNPAAASSASRSSVLGWIMKHWLTLSMMILVLVGVAFFWPKKGQESAATVQVQQQSAELDMSKLRLAEAEARASQVEAQAQAQAKAKEEEIIFNEKLEAAKREHIARLIESPKARISEVTHNPNEGGVVRSLGDLKKKNGASYRLLHTEAGTGRRKVLMYPASRPLPEINANLSFSGLKPPTGELAVFDTVDHPDWGPMNVFAWKLSQ